MRVTLTIKRWSGDETRRVEPGELFGLVEGPCPNCGTTPFRVQGVGLEGNAEVGYVSGGVSVCCRDNVGWIYAEPLTELLSRGWQVAGTSYVKPGQAREYRVVLVNRALGLKRFGFGDSFEAAFADAERQR